jgi:hypothetical protein
MDLDAQEVVHVIEVGSWMMVTMVVCS